MDLHINLKLWLDHLNIKNKNLQILPSHSNISLHNNLKKKSINIYKKKKDYILTL